MIFSRDFITLGREINVLPAERFGAELSVRRGSLDGGYYAERYPDLEKQVAVGTLTATESCHYQPECLDYYTLEKGDPGPELIRNLARVTLMGETLFELTSVNQIGLERVNLCFILC